MATSKLMRDFMADVRKIGIDMKFISSYQDITDPEDNPYCGLEDNGTVIRMIDTVGTTVQDGTIDDFKNKSKFKQFQNAVRAKSRESKYDKLNFFMSNRGTWAYSEKKSIG